MHIIIKYTSCIIVIGLLVYMLHSLETIDIDEVYSQVVNSNNKKFEWIPFNSHQGVNISTIGHESIPVFLLYGDSGIQNEGFSSYKLFNGSFIVVTTGTINKTNQNTDGPDPQFTLSFKIIGDNNIYSVIFVNGRLFEEGWSDHNYYVPISENSTKIVNLTELIYSQRDKYLSIEKITAGVEKNAHVGQILFSIDLVRGDIPR